VPLTQIQVASAVADRAQLSKADAKRALAALDEAVLDELGNAQKVRIGGLAQLTVRVRPAQKARKGRNPATGEEITIAAKPASVDLRAAAAGAGEGSAAVGAKGASPARGLSEEAVPPLHGTVSGQGGLTPAANTRRVA
jgi:DNA-binding protein HU-beta